MQEVSLLRRLVAEFVGTAFLVAIVVGSGIAAQRLSPDDIGLQLLENALITGAGLLALIVTFGSISGAQFNPVVSLMDAGFGGLPWRYVPGYVLAQIAGGILGAIIANIMFDLDAVNFSTKDRSAGNLVFAEFIATLGLGLIIFGLVRAGRTSAIAFAVAGYITAAYWFTSSTSFANPAVTISRMFSDTFAGIEPASVPAFIGAQFLGGLVAVALVLVLWPVASTTIAQATAIDDLDNPAQPAPTVGSS